MLEEIISVLEEMQGSEISSLTKNDKKQFDKEISSIVNDVRKMNGRMQSAVDKLRTTADYLDKVWKDCRIAAAVGSGTGVVGGLLAIGGGVATILSAGAATPLLIAGIAVGAAGTGTKLGTNSIEAVINSSQVKEADEVVNAACEIAKNVRNKVEMWSGRETRAKQQFLGYLASKMVDIELDTKTMSVIYGMLRSTGSFVQTSETCVAASAETTAKAAGNAGAKLGAKAAGGIIIGVSAAFVVWDAVDFGFTVRDLVQDKKSEAAKELRQRAKEIESQLLGQ